MKRFTSQVVAATLVAAGAFAPGYSPASLRTGLVPTISAAERQGDLNGAWILNLSLIHI